MKNQLTVDGWQLTANSYPLNPPKGDLNSRALCARFILFALLLSFGFGRINAQTITVTDSVVHTLFGDSSGSITLYATGVSYHWNTGDTTNQITDLGEGLYFVTVSDGTDSVVREYVIYNYITWGLLVNVDETANHELICTSDWGWENAVDNHAVSADVFEADSTAVFVFEFDTVHNFAGIIALVSDSLLDENTTAFPLFVFTIPVPEMEVPACILAPSNGEQEFEFLGSVDTTRPLRIAFYRRDNILTITKNEVMIFSTDSFPASVNMRAVAAPFFNGSQVKYGVYGKPFPLQITTETNHTTCAGNDGSIVVFPKYGFPPYSYEWSNSNTTASITNLVAGAYSVIVSDAIGNSVVISDTVVTAEASLLVSDSVVHTTFGNSEGSITLKVTNELTSCVSYQWNTGDTTHQIINLPEGDYSVTVTFASDSVVKHYGIYNYSTWSLLRNVNETGTHELVCTNDFDGDNIFENLAFGAETFLPDSTTTVVFNFDTGQNSLVYICGLVTDTLFDDSTSGYIILAVLTDSVPDLEKGIYVPSHSEGGEDFIYLGSIGDTVPLSISLIRNGTAVTLLKNGIECLVDTFPVSQGVHATVAPLLENSRVKSVVWRSYLYTPMEVSAEATPAEDVNATGSITTTVIGGIPPYSFSPLTPEGGISPQPLGNGVFQYANVPVGEYQLTVTDANNNSVTKNVFVGGYADWEILNNLSENQQHEIRAIINAPVNGENVFGVGIGANKLLPDSAGIISFNFAAHDTFSGAFGLMTNPYSFFIDTFENLLFGIVPDTADDRSGIYFLPDLEDYGGDPVFVGLWEHSTPLNIRIHVSPDSVNVYKNEVWCYGSAAHRQTILQPLVIPIIESSVVRSVITDIRKSAGGFVTGTNAEIVLLSCDSNTSGSIALTDVSGTPPFSYEWKSPPTPEGGVIGTDSVITGLEVGDYAVTITDNNNDTTVRFFRVGYDVQWDTIWNIIKNEDGSLEEALGDSTGTGVGYAANTLYANENGWVDFALEEGSSGWIFALLGMETVSDYDSIVSKQKGVRKGVAALAFSSYVFVFVVDTPRVRWIWGGMLNLAQENILHIEKVNDTLRILLNGILLDESPFAAPFMMKPFIGYSKFSSIPLYGGVNGNMKYVAASFCNDSALFCRDSLDPVAITILQGADTVCAGTQITLTATSYYGATMEWFANATDSTGVLVATGDTVNITVDSSTTFYVRNRSYCPGVDSVMVSRAVGKSLTAWAIPEPPVAPASQNICSDTFVRFTFTNIEAGEGGNQIEWATNSNFTGSRFDSSSADVSFTVAPGANREISIRSRDTVIGCVSTPVTATATVYVLPIAIEPIALRNTICPNSSTDILIPYSEGGKRYLLKNDTTIIVEGNGTGNTLALNTGAIDTTTVFAVVATDTLTECSIALPLITVIVSDTLDAPEFTQGDSVLYCYETLQYKVENLNGGNVSYFIDSGSATIDSISGWVSDVSSGFIVSAITTTTSGCYVENAYKPVQYFSKPEILEAPLAQSAWSDTPVVFHFNVLFSRGTERVEWSYDSLFESYSVLNESGIISLPVDTGTTETIWLRGVNISGAAYKYGDPVSTHAEVRYYKDEHSVEPSDYVELYTDASFNRGIGEDNEVGTTPQFSDVTPYGAAVYTIPIVCPPGTNNMVPQIALSYNSQGGNGPLGWGWSISGLSAISRQGFDNFHDQKVGPITLTNNDFYNLDGVRLMPRNGNNGADGTTYVKEAEDYSIIESKSSAGNGPGWFKVTTKEGIVMEYGNTADSRLLTSDLTEVLQWKLNKVYDQNGNYILYKYNNFYLNSKQENIIAEINYTGNGSVAPYNAIFFNYTSRDDNNTVFTAGTGVSVSKLLYSIGITDANGGDFFKQYALTYGKDDMYSYLTSVTEYGTDNTHLNPTIFKYGNSPSLGSYSVNISQFDDSYKDYINSNSGSTHCVYSGNNPNLNEIEVNRFTDPNHSLGNGDFNGDGYSDVLMLYQAKQPVPFLGPYSVCDATITYNLGFGVYFNNPSTNSFQKKGADYWKDYLTDNVYTEHGVNDINEYKILQIDHGNYNYITGDFLGTGRDGILEVGKYCTNSNVYNSNILGFSYAFGTIKYYTFDDAGNRTETDFLSPANTERPIDGTGFISVGDFDGDGALDYILYSYTGSYISFPSKNIFNASVTTPYIQIPTDDLYAFVYTYVIDFDGDGKKDIFYPSETDSKVYTFSSSGGTYHFDLAATISGVTSYSNIKFGDFNGDGKTDIISGGSGSGAWAIGNSTGKGYADIGIFSHPSFGGNQLNWDGTSITFPNSAAYNSAKDSVPELIVSDFNGDGKSDVLMRLNLSSCQSIVKIYYSTGLSFKKYDLNIGTLAGTLHTGGDFNGDGRADLITGIAPCGSGNPNPAKNVYKFSFNPFGQERLLQKVSDPFNQVKTFAYKTLTDASVHTKGANHTYPVTSMQYPLYVVSAVWVPDGTGGNNLTSYFYTNALVHRGGLGFLGFDYIRSNSSVLNTTNVIHSTFAAPYFSPSAISTTTSVGGTNISIDNTTFNQVSLGNNRYAVQKAGTYTQNLLANTYSSTQYNYDQFGNVRIASTDVNGIENTFVGADFGRNGMAAFPAFPLRILTLKTRQGAAQYANLVVNTYDSKDRLKTHKTAQGTSCSIHYDFSYDRFGNRFITNTQTATTTGGVRTQVSTYDPQGRFPVRVSNSLNQETVSQYDANWGKPVSVTGVDGNTTTYEYDAYGRVVSTTEPRGNIIETTYEWAINYGGSKSIFLVTSAPPGKPTVKGWYDAFGREVRKQIMGFGGNWLTGTTLYNGSGKPVMTVKPAYSSESPSFSYCTYDNLNRLVSVWDQFGNINITSYAYSSGNLSATTTNSQTGRWSRRTIDATGKVVEAADAGGTLSYKYDSYGNQTEVKSGSTILMTTAYDACNHKTSTVEPNAGTFEYQYDGYGQLLHQTEGSGRTYDMRYDALGRITQCINDEGTADEATSSYSYVTSGNGINQIYAISSFSGIWQYFGYNQFADVTSVQEIINGNSYTTSRTYDGYGNNTSVTYPSGIVIENDFDTYGYRTAITNASTSNVLYTVNEMNSYGQATEYESGNGKTSYITTHYNIPTDYSTTGVQNLVLDYDFNSGDLLQRTEGAYSEAFTYDNSDRLTSSQMIVNGYSFAPPAAYTYAANGNLTAKADIGNYAYNSSKINAVTHISNPDHTISDEEQNITYIGFNKAETITEGDYELTYTYDASYNRKFSELKENNVTKNTKIYSGNYEINDDQTSDPQELHYIYGDNGLVAIIVKDNSGTNEYYTYTDQLGSIVKVTDDGGTVIASQSFDAWGRKRHPANWSYSGIPNVPSWLYRGYTGHEMLPEFELINMNGRMYDPLLGRMLNPDNVVSNPENTQRYNRYSYVMNNPLKYTDPTGWDPIGSVNGPTVVITGSYGGGSVGGFNFVIPGNSPSGLCGFLMIPMLGVRYENTYLNTLYSMAWRYNTSSSTHESTQTTSGEKLKGVDGRNLYMGILSAENLNPQVPQYEITIDVMTQQLIKSVNPEPSAEVQYVASLPVEITFTTVYESNPNDYRNQYGDPSTSLENFRDNYCGLPLEQIVTGRSSFLGYEFPNYIDPNFRFVNLNSGRQVDMTHFLVVGPRGHFMGMINEIKQIFSHPQSAFYPQDLYSNWLGVNFFNSYGALIEQNPNNISNYIYQFLSDTRNTNFH